MQTTSSFQTLLDPHLLSFYGWWQMAVCLFAFAALMAIWWHIGRRRKDVGQVWLALSVLCWSFSGGVEVFYANQFMVEGKVVLEKADHVINSVKIDSTDLFSLKKEHETIKEQQLAQSYQLNGWRSIFSLFNSLFILLALPWFKYIPKRIGPIIKSKYWHYIVGLPFLFSLLPTTSKMLSGQPQGLVSELDFYYAILTLIFLGYVLWESFEKRRLPMLAWLSAVCILITFVAQLGKFFPNLEIDQPLFSAIFKTSLIMIFFALALSWVKELAENVIPEPKYLSITLNRQKNSNGKFENTVSFNGIPGKEENKIRLTPTLFELFVKFAERKKQEGDDWLEIKPKNETRSSKTYDINDHNEIKRLLTALLDALFGKGLWTKEKHYEPLKNSLFEMSERRERKIRLRLPVENILLKHL